MDEQNLRQSSRAGMGRKGASTQGGPDQTQGPRGPQKPGTQKKKPSLFLRVILFLVALAMVLGAVAAVAFRDVLNLDSIKRWFNYRALMLSDSGQAEAFVYDGSLEDTFAVLDGDLLVCSQNAISLYSGSGTQYVSQPVSLENPVVDTNGSLAVVYDAGGSSLYVLGQRALIWSDSGLDGILSARLNHSGMLTVVTQASGYRGVVTVYNSAYEAVASIQLSSAFVMDAALSDDGRTLAIVTIGQQNGAFSSNLVLYTLNSAQGTVGESSSFTADLTASLGGNVVLDLRHTDELVWTLGDQGLAITDHEGKSASANWSNQYLKLYDLSGDGFAAALLGKYRAGSQATLQVIDDTGTVKGSLDLNQQVLSLSAAGRYLAVLTGDRLDIYTSDLSLYSSLEGTQGARKVLLMEDGSAILISEDSASFYVPG